jgi:hypothetical protein
VYTDVVTISGNGTYTTASGNNGGGFLPTAVGTYQWVAVYSGDGNNNSVTEASGNEPEAVNQASPTITTTPGGTVVVGGTGKLTDSATLSGGYSPSGTITFTLYSPSNQLVYTDVVTISGNGTYSTASGTNAGGYLPTAAGTYQWVASYSGDSNNNTVSEANGNEPEAVSPASPAIVTTAGATIILGSSSKLTDTATLSGGYVPSGSITFNLYGPSSTVVDTETATVSGNGNYSTPTGYVPTAAGSYYWVASYGGDTNNNTATGVHEPETVSAVSPAIATTPGGTVQIGAGTNLTDSATLSGGYSPTGTITFTLYSPSNAVVYTDVVTVNSGNGTYTTASGTNPGGFAPTTAGIYQWAASYSGDSNNNAVSEASGNEPESAYQCALSSIQSNFNGTAIPAGDTIWFNSVFNPSGVSTTQSTTFTFTNQTITFTAGGTNYTVAVPNATIVFTPTVTTATTTFNTTTDTWITTAPPSGLSGNMFLSGVGYLVPAGVSLAGTNPVTWQGSFSTDTSGVSLNWQWAAAVYTNASFPSGPTANYNTADVKPSDDNQKCQHYPNNSDHAGTPEAYKSYVTGGARGGGGSNWTGSYSGTASASVSGGTICDMLSPSTGSISGYVYIDTNDDGIQETGEPGLSGVTVTLTGTTSYGQSVSLTTTTNSSGAYSFANLLPGTSYTVQTSPTPPSGYTAGLATIGSSGGTDSETLDQLYVALGQGIVSINNDFGELLTLSTGMTATIGFWQNQNGQAIINGFGTTSTGQTVANWLASTFPNLFGTNGVIANLTNATNAQVAAAYTNVFGNNKTQAQIFCAALSIFTTSTSLNTNATNQSLAKSYGFVLSNTGSGAAAWNIGSSDNSAFNASANATLSVYQMLLTTNSQVSNGQLFGGNSSQINEANDAFSNINQNGDI